MTDTSPSAIPTEVLGSVDNDPRVREAVVQLALDVIEEARLVLRDCMPATKIQLIKVILPAATRALSTDTSGDELKDLREHLESFYSGFREDIGATVDETADDLPDDE